MALEGRVCIQLRQVSCNSPYSRARISCARLRSTENSHAATLRGEMHDWCLFCDCSSVLIAFLMCVHDMVNTKESWSSWDLLSETASRIGLLLLIPVERLRLWWSSKFQKSSCKFLILWSRARSILACILCVLTLAWLHVCTIHTLLIYTCLTEWMLIVRWDW